MIERLIEGYEEAKKPIAYIIMMAAVIFTTIPIDVLPDKLKYAPMAVLLVLALIILEILFEIYEKVVKGTRKMNQINSNDLYNEIQGIVGNEKKVSIKLIGVAGRFGWQNVLEKLLNENDPDSLISNRTEFDIKIALIDPKMCKENKYMERFDGVASTIKSIEKTTVELAGIAEKGSKLKLYTYDYMPNMLGVLVDDNYLFLTYTYWEYKSNELFLRAGGSDYFVYDKNDDFGGQELIKRFTGWFEFITTVQDQKEADTK